MPQFWQDMFGGGFLSSALDGLSWPFAFLGRAFARTAISALFALEWAVVGFGAAYGYGYFRLGAFLLALWLMGGVIYEGAANQGAFAPSNPALYLNKELQAKCGENWTQCSGAPAEMPGFSPYIYSLDVMLPGLDLGQKHDWQPVYRPDRRMRMGLPRIENKPEGDPDRTMVPQFSFEARAARRGHARYYRAHADAAELAGAGPAVLDPVRGHQEGLKKNDSGLGRNCPLPRSENKPVGIWRPNPDSASKPARDAR